MSESQPAPPYVPYTTFKNSIRALAASGQMPSRVDKSLFPTLSGSTRNLLISAMSNTMLIEEDGSPTSELESLAAASDSEWPKLLKAWIARNYNAKQLEAIEKGTPQQLKESIGDHSASTRDKAIRFLVSAAEDCGLPIAPHHARSRTTNGSNSGQRRTRRRRPSKAPETPTETTARQATDVDVIPIMIPGKPGGQIVLPKSIDENDITLLAGAFEYAKLYIQNKKGESHEKG